MVSTKLRVKSRHTTSARAKLGMTSGKDSDEYIV